MQDSIGRIIELKICMFKKTGISPAMGILGARNKRGLIYFYPSLQRGQLTGSSRFVDEIEKKIARRVEFRGQGRPSKTNK